MHEVKGLKILLKPREIQEAKGLIILMVPEKYMRLKD
jgi:hypothetical protein